MKDYRCFCKSKKGSKMSYYDGNPRRYASITRKAPFGRGEYGMWCKKCGKVGLRKLENMVLITGTTHRRSVNNPVILVDILAEEEMI